MDETTNLEKADGRRIIVNFWRHELVHIGRVVNAVRIGRVYDVGRVRVGEMDPYCSFTNNNWLIAQSIAKITKSDFEVQLDNAAIVVVCGRITVSNAVYNDYTDGYLSNRKNDY